MTSPTRRGSRSDLPRELVLQEIAVDSARAWTSRLFRALADERRRVAGGWPGIMTEARATLAGDAARVLDDRAMAALTRDELSRLTWVMYREARRLWLAAAAAR